MKANRRCFVASARWLARVTTWSATTWSLMTWLGFDDLVPLHDLAPLMAWLGIDGLARGCCSSNHSGKEMGKRKRVDGRALSGSRLEVELLMNLRSDTTGRKDLQQQRVP